MRRVIFFILLLLSFSLFLCASGESLFYVGNYEDEISNGTWNADHTMLQKPFIFASEAPNLTQEEMDYLLSEAKAMGYEEEDLFYDLEPGWSDDESLYVCYGDVSISIRDEFSTGDIYRVAAFSNSDDYGLSAEYGIIDTIEVEDCHTQNRSFYLTISNQPGLYRDITVVVSGNGMVSVKTFDVQVIDYPSYYYTDYGYSRDSEDAYGFVYGDYIINETPMMASRKITPYEEAEPNIPYNDFIISWPTEGSVFSGYEGITTFGINIEIKTSVNTQEPEYALLTLAHSETGEIISEGKWHCSGYSQRDTHNRYIFNDWFEPSFTLPADWESGEYRLTLELEGLGSHSVDIVLEKEAFNPSEYYEPFTTEKLRLLFGEDRYYYYEIPGQWNEDHTVYTLTGDGTLSVRAAGTDPDKEYICALLYKDADGHISYTADYLNEDYPTDLFVSSKKGTYEDLVLILTGNGETIIHSFDCISDYVTDSISYGVVFGNARYFVTDNQMKQILSIYNDYQEMLALQPEYTDTGVIQYSENSILPEINHYMEKMEIIETDAFLKYIRYASKPGSDDLLASFAILSPNVPAQQVEDALANPVHAANWSVHKAFAFQQDSAFHYCENDFIDLQALNAFFGDRWIDLCALEFASGTASDLSGAKYTWMPVYYDDGQGGFHQDKLYLYVYIAYPGADDEYLAPFNYFNPLFYNEYHTAELMITDQAEVYTIMNKLRSLNHAFEHMADTTKYTHLKEGASGEYVRRLQVRLTELGYLTSSVDGEFTPPVTEAIKAYQTDHGLEATGTANQELQKMILDPTKEKQMLLTWLEGHEEVKESDKE